MSDKWLNYRLFRTGKHIANVQCPRDCHVGELFDNIDDIDFACDHRLLNALDIGAVDIETEHKAFALLRKILSHTPGGKFVIGEDAVCEYCNVPMTSLEHEPDCAWNNAMQLIAEFEKQATGILENS